MTWVDRDKAAVAAEAVAHAARPGLLEAVRLRSVTWPSADLVEDLRVLLVAALEGGWHAREAGPFWEATGRGWT